MALECVLIDGWGIVQPYRRDAAGNVNRDAPAQGVSSKIGEVSLHLVGTNFTAEKRQRGTSTLSGNRETGRIRIGL